MSLKAIILCAAAGLFCGGAAQAADADHGEGLHAERCAGCHGSEVYTRPNRHMKSLTSLETQVQRCTTNLSIQWLPDEVADVTAYLNRDFYKFPSD